MGSSCMAPSQQVTGWHCFTARQMLDNTITSLHALDQPTLQLTHQNKSNSIQNLSTLNVLKHSQVSSRHSATPLSVQQPPEAASLQAQAPQRRPRARQHRRGRRRARRPGWAPARPGSAAARPAGAPRPPRARGARAAAGPPPATRPPARRARAGSAAGRHPSQGTRMHVAGVKSCTQQRARRARTQRGAGARALRRAGLLPAAPRPTERRPAHAAAPQAPLEALRGVPGNYACADCGAPDPDRASLNLGALLGIQCRGGAPRRRTRPAGGARRRPAGACGAGRRCGAPGGPAAAPGRPRRARPARAPGPRARPARPARWPPPPAARSPAPRPAPRGTCGAGATGVTVIIPVTRVSGRPRASWCRSWSVGCI